MLQSVERVPECALGPLNISTVTGRELSKSRDSWLTRSTLYGWEQQWCDICARVVGPTRAGCQAR